MFMQRLITSLILIPIVLLTIFYAPAWVLGGLVLLVVLVAATECWQLIPTEYPLARIGFVVALFLCLGLCYMVFPYWQTWGLILWLFIYVAICTFPSSQRYWGHPGIVATLCLIVIPLFVLSLVQIYYMPQGKSLLVYLLFLIWAADVGAYLAGKQWGKHKLIPQVSPGKSWEGIAGGFSLALLVAFIGYVYYTPYSAVIWFGIAMVTVVVSIFGDLFVSILKRRCHLKDTGAIIPGHGGILDRLDSLIAALPVFYFGLTYIPLGV